MYLYYIYISTAEAGEVTDATTKIASSGSAIKAVKDVLDGAMANVGDLGKPLEKTESVVNVTKDFWALSEYKPPKMNTSSVSVYRGLVSACLNHMNQVVEKKMIGMMAGHKSSVSEIVFGGNETIILESETVKARWAEKELSVLGLVLFSKEHEALQHESIRCRLQELASGSKVALLHFNAKPEPDMYELHDSELQEVRLVPGSKQKGTDYYSYFLDTMGKTGMDVMTEAVEAAMEETVKGINNSKDSCSGFRRVRVPADGFL